MLVKIVTFFLIGMMVLGLFGKLRFPKVPRLKRAAKCSICGAPQVGSGPCPCGSRGK